MPVDPTTRKQLAQFKKDLAVVDKSFPKMLQKVNKVVAKTIGDAAQSKMAGLGPIQQKAAPAVKGYATAVAAEVGAKRTATVPTNDGPKRIPMTAIWGAKRRIGWYNRGPAYSAEGARQLPPWVGNTWDAGVSGQGPYAINDAIAEHEAEVMAAWGIGIGELMRVAYPDP